MKSNLNIRHPKPKELPFPKLMINYSTSTVILASGPGPNYDDIVGVVVVSGKRADVGKYSNKWSLCQLESLPEETEVTLIQSMTT